jgi:two-component system cell cycle sensor histidine kinase/response regulator CckA
MTAPLQPKAQEPHPPSNGRWILVVDDEPAMRMLIELVLNAKGWTVRTADGAGEALAAIGDGAKPPVLVICDVLMPGIDGLELVRRMRDRVSGLNVLFISGRLTEASLWPSDLRDQRFLQKPFDDRQLLAAVHDALGDRGPDAQPRR